MTTPSIGGVSWSPDGAHIAYSAGSQTIHHDEAPAYSGAKIIYTVTRPNARGSFVSCPQRGPPVSIGMRVASRHAVGGRNHTLFFRTGRCGVISEAYYLVGGDRPAESPCGRRRWFEEEFWSIANAGDASQASPERARIGS